MSILALVTTNEPVRAAAPFVITSSGSATTDGVPNDWWDTYFPGDTAAWVAANDPDGDGQPNGAEYPAGTSPVDASSVFAITSVTRVGTNVSITWSAVGGKSYAVDSLASLGATNNWQPVGLSLLAPPGATSLSTNTFLADPEGFLRVRLVP
jgi:hypothetical protein